MRPLQIILEGFSAYRNRETLLLEDVEFFSLSGPTGSGKSSLIDAMIFALYGRVPRLGGRAVAPVITAGADRARVSFRFEASGETYVVSRVAERTDSGAAVREARLETGEGTPLASGAGDVTREIEDLLHLRFEDFTKTVVLPQGEFARFLNAGSKERRDLLRDLLGLEVYTRVRELANERRSAAEALGVSARSQLESLEVPEGGALDEARVRLASLDDLAGSIDDLMVELESAESDLQVAQKELETLDDARERLVALEAPLHLEEMDDRLVAAREAESLADDGVQAHREKMDGIEAGLAALPSPDSIKTIRHTHAQLSTLEERIEALGLELAESGVVDAGKALTRAQTQAAFARESAEKARATHAAHVVRSSLVVGEPCPVCSHEVTHIPSDEASAELDEVERAVGAAEVDLRQARESLEGARIVRSEIEARLSEMTSQRGSIVQQLEGAPALPELDEADRQRSDLDDLRTAARSRADHLATALRQSRRAHEEAAESVRSVGRMLMVAREQIADLRPPHSESDDPTVQWKELLDWRGRRLDEVVEEIGTVTVEVERRAGIVSRTREVLVETLERAGVSPTEPYAVQVEREREKARHRVTQIEEILERAARLKEELAMSSGREAVAGALANHLRANGFERWLMAGAITGLVNGANDLLDQLSGGGYSLESDEDGSFRIIDHRNADEIRDVATLSGGETFLVSLALSLSLAETLSASGGSGLDAIILDEGFGTLDEESLDVVASVLEELAGRGLMVGIITHVKELAARASVRYEVSRGPGGASVRLAS